MLEKTFQKKVLVSLRRIKKSWWVKINDRVTIGLPDIVGLIDGHFVAIELKTKSKLSPLQKFTLELIKKAGGSVFVMRPENADEVFKKLGGKLSSTPKAHAQ